MSAGWTCLCTGQWERAVRCVLREKESRVESSRVEYKRVQSRVESRRVESSREKKVGGENGENGECAAVARLRVGERTVIKK